MIQRFEGSPKWLGVFAMTVVVNLRPILVEGRIAFFPLPYVLVRFLFRR